MLEKQLFEAIRRGPYRARVDNDDLDWIGAIIIRELGSKFQFTYDPKPGHDEFVRDLEAGMGEVLAREELDQIPADQRPEWAADYLSARLEEKWRFRVKLSWYMRHGSPRADQPIE